MGTAGALQGCLELFFSLLLSMAHKEGKKGCCLCPHWAWSVATGASSFVLDERDRSACEYSVTRALGSAESEPACLAHSSAQQTHCWKHLCAATVFSHGKLAHGSPERPSEGRKKCCFLWDSGTPSCPCKVAAQYQSEGSFDRQGASHTTSIS